MRTWVRLVLYCVFLATPCAALAADIPMDDSGFTNYIQQRLQLYSRLPIKVTGPFEVVVVAPAGLVSFGSFKTIHDVCVREPAKCQHAADVYVQNTVRDIQRLSNAVDAQDAGQAARADDAVIPSDERGFMAYVAAALGKLLPGDKIVVSGFELDVTRPSGRSIPFDGREGYAACATENFHCSTIMGAYLTRMSNWLTVASPQNLRVALHVMASCNIIASVGNSLGCRVVPRKEPMAPFFRRAFSNLEEICFKQISDDMVVPMTNADRHDLDMTIDAGVELCEKSMHAAFDPLAAKIQPLPADGIGTIADAYASSRAIFHDDWSVLAKEYGGHLLVAVPARDTLLYMKGDSPPEVAALGARAQAAFAGSGLAISSDVYRWSDSGWTLATAQSTMNGGPRISTDLMPHVH